MGKRRTTNPRSSDLGGSLHAAIPDDRIDLHGMTRDQALRRVEMLLDTWERRGGEAVLRIVTGRGNRSKGEPVLLHAVGRRLREELDGRIAEMARDVGGGGWLVRMSGGPASTGS